MLEFLTDRYESVNSVSLDGPAYELGQITGIICGLGVGLLIAFAVYVRCKYKIYHFNETKRGFQGFVSGVDSRITACTVLKFLREREKQAKCGWLHGDGVPLNGWTEIDPDDEVSTVFLGQFIYRLKKLGLDFYLYEIGKIDTTTEEEKDVTEEAIRKTLFPVAKKITKERRYPYIFSLLLFLLSSVSLLALAAFIIYSIPEGVQFTAPLSFKLTGFQ